MALQKICSKCTCHKPTAWCQLECSTGDHGKNVRGEVEAEEVTQLYSATMTFTVVYIFTACPTVWSLLTENDGQHLSGLFLPSMHAPESWIVGMRMRHRPQRCVCPPVRQILHLAAHPDRRLFLLAAFRPLLPSLLVQIQLGAAAGGMANAAAVLRVHWGQHGVLYWSRFRAFAPQASRQ